MAMTEEIIRDAAKQCIDAAAPGLSAELRTALAGNIARRAVAAGIKAEDNDGPAPFAMEEAAAIPDAARGVRVQHD